MQSAGNKRKDHRIPKVLKVKIDRKGREVWGVLQNLSLDGLYVKTNCAFTKGETIVMELWLPDGDKSKVKGSVRRIEEKPDRSWNFGIGVKLLDNDVRYLHYVKKLNEQFKRANEELLDQARSKLIIV